jgi:hypothetical protein
LLLHFFVRAGHNSLCRWIKHPVKLSFHVIWILSVYMEVGTTLQGGMLGLALLVRSANKTFLNHPILSWRLSHWAHGLVAAYGLTGCMAMPSNRAANLDIRHRIKMESCKKSSNMCVGDKKIWQGSYFTKRNDKVRIHRKKRVGIV